MPDCLVVVLQALEYQAGFPVNSGGGEVAMSQQQWEEFLNGFRDRLKLLRLIANVSSRDFAGSRMEDDV